MKVLQQEHWKDKTENCTQSVGGGGMIGRGKLIGRRELYEIITA